MRRRSWSPGSPPRLRFRPTGVIFGMALPKLDLRQSARRSQGLDGKWLAIDELLQLEAFKQVKRSKLNNAMRVPPDSSEPDVRAAVRREIEPGAFICVAGEYGSTAF